MNSRAFISVFVTASILFFPGVTFAKTASCPCSPCKCSPCTCGGGGSKSSGGKHHDRHGHDHGSSFGVGGTVDLGGIGHRTSEPNPFGVGGGEKPVAHTEEKRTTKRKEHEPTGSTFDEIKLTGIEGKGEIAPSGTFNVNNDDDWFSGFYATTLPVLLPKLGVSRVVLTGVALTPPTGHSDHVVGTIIYRADGQVVTISFTAFLVGRMSGGECILVGTSTKATG